MKVQYLYDTNIISEIMRPKPNSGVVHQFTKPQVLGISTVTIEEIIFGLNFKDAHKQMSWFDQLLEQHANIFPVTQEIAIKAGQLRGRFRLKGIQRTQADMLIASTTLCHDLILVTRNIDDFAGCQIKVLNPFD